MMGGSCMPMTTGSSPVASWKAGLTPGITHEAE